MDGRRKGERRGMRTVGGRKGMEEKGIEESSKGKERKEEKGTDGIRKLKKYSSFCLECFILIVQSQSFKRTVPVYILCSCTVHTL